MTFLLSDASPVFLMSLYKPVVLLAALTGWGWTVTKIDKDTLLIPLPRQMWNAVQLVAGALAVLLWLMIPWFWLGLFVAVLVAGGAITGYIFLRNSKVPPAARWRLSLQSFQNMVSNVKTEQAQRKALVHFLQKDGRKINVPTGEDPLVTPHQKFEDLVTFALPRRADRVDLIVGANQQLAVLVYVDGVKFVQEGYDTKAVVAMIDYLKQRCGLDVEDRRKRQTAQFQIDAGEFAQHTLALLTQGSTRELSLSLRIDPDLRAAVGLKKIGLLENQRQQLERTLKQENGVVIVAAPPRQGLTTTLYSLLHEHDPYMQSIVTIEDEIAFEVEGVNHNELGIDVDAAVLAEKLAALLRQDPQVLMLSRLPDSQAARLVAKAAREVRLYVGVRQEDTINTLKLWLKSVGDAKAALAGLHAVMAQRLVRKLCTTCRQPYKPEAALLQKLNITLEKAPQLYKHSGQVLVKNKAEPCPDCHGLGYRGRIGVFEVMVLDDPGRQLILANQFDQFRAHLRKNKMLYLQEAALARVVDGTTSISEITRALGGK